MNRLTCTYRRFHIGLDLGRTQDYTAISILERSLLRSQQHEPVEHRFISYDTLSVVYLYRFPLRTPYPEVVERVRRLIESQPLLENAHLAIDATGAGLPIYEFIKKNPSSKPRARIVPISITSGTTVSSDGVIYCVPRALLLNTLETHLVEKTLGIASRLPLAPVLLRELAQLRVGSTSTGKPRIETAKSNQHDDLVFATALATFCNERFRLMRSPTDAYTTVKYPEGLPL